MRHFRASLTTDASKTIAAAIVGSRLDFCNSLLAGTSVSNLTHLQLVQNTLARVVAQIISHPSQLFRLLEELSNIIYSCLLTLTVVQNLVWSNQLNVSHFVIQCQVLPSHSPEIPCRPSKSVPSERLRLVRRFILHRLHTGAWVNLVLLTYLLMQKHSHG